VKLLAFAGGETLIKISGDATQNKMNTSWMSMGMTGDKDEADSY
jgi:hypothetical protein